MTRTLRTLILEDDRDDAEQMVRELHREGFDVDWLRVDSEQEYLKRLEWNPEVILADYTLPGFNAIDALHLLHKSQLQIPFIIVSGSIGEDRAVVAMREGVTDYLLKDRLGRLGSAVTQALEKRQLELEAKQAEE